MATPETVVQLPVDALVPSTANPRIKLRGLDELADSVKEHGVLEPLLVTGNGHSTFVVLAGHRRLAAAKKAGLKTVPCLVREYSEGAQLEIQLIENLQRDDLSPLEEAKGFGQLVELKKSTREIARLVGRSQSHVMHRLSILRLSPKALEQLEKFTVEDIAALAALPHERQDRILTETKYGTIAGRIRELQWRDQDEKRRAADAKKPKTADDKRFEAQAAASRAAERKKDKLRREANEARTELLPRLLSRGERELQYAAGVLAESVSTIPAHRAGELLELAPVTRRGFSDWSEALLKHAGKSRKAAVDVLLAVAIAEAEERIRGTYVGGSPLSRLHIERLQKVGYKPNARDRQLLKVRGR